MKNVESKEDKMKELNELKDKLIANLEEVNKMKDNLIELLRSHVKGQKRIIRNLKLQLEIMEMRIQL